MTDTTKNTISPAEIDRLPSELIHLIRKLELENTPLDDYKLKELFGSLSLSRPDVESIAAFSDRSYRRIPIARFDHAELLLMCWKAGQFSPIHDHAGSRCGVFVVEGEVSELRFSKTPFGALVPSHFSVYRQGHSCVSFDKDIHMLCNLQKAPADLITLHCYSPPLAMTLFSLSDTCFATHDEIFPARK
jgi:cysteine dioxygenase